MLISPIRRAEIRELAAFVRRTYPIYDMGRVSQMAGIYLVRSAGPQPKPSGFAHTERESVPMHIESIANAGEWLRVWGMTQERLRRTIVINTTSDLPEREIFWHEFYHLFYSPMGLDRMEDIRSHFSTLGALHAHEERRAQDFAAYVLIPYVDGFRDVPEIAEHFGVSEGLAKRAVKLYRAITL